MSNKIAEPSAGYFGIINGIIYRIDANTGLSERMSGFAPLEIPSRPAPAHPLSGKAIHPRAANPAAPPPAAAAIGAQAQRLAQITPVIEAMRVEKEEQETKLFNRDGAEPLRAGHPDLWNLLVAGTCLEGSTFHSAG